MRTAGMGLGKSCRSRRQHNSLRFWLLSPSYFAADAPAGKAYTRPKTPTHTARPVAFQDKGPFCGRLLQALRATGLERAHATLLTTTCGTKANFTALNERALQAEMRSMGAFPVRHVPRRPLDQTAPRSTLQSSTIWAQPPVVKHHSIPRLEWPLVVPRRLRPEPPPPAWCRPVTPQPPVPVPLPRSAPPSPRLQALPVCAPATACAAAAVTLLPRRLRPILLLLVAMRSPHGRQPFPRPRPRPRRLLPDPHAHQRDGAALIVAVVAVYWGAPIMLSVLQGETSSSRRTSPSATGTLRASCMLTATHVRLQILPDWEWWSGLNR